MYLFLPMYVFTYVIDIIGVVEEFDEVIKIPTRYGQQDIVKFKLCDSRFEIIAYSH